MYYLIFLILAVVELYFFAMQRSSLEISRLFNIDSKKCRLLLPLWYALVWPVKIVRYYVAYKIYMEFGAWPALGCLVAPVVISTFMKIPHNHFIPMFNKKLDSGDGIISEEDFFILSNALDSIGKNEH